MSAYRTLIGLHTSVGPGKIGQRSWGVMLWQHGNGGCGYLVADGMKTRKEAERRASAIQREIKRSDRLGKYLLEAAYKIHRAIKYGDYA